MNDGVTEKVKLSTKLNDREKLAKIKELLTKLEHDVQEAKRILKGKST